MEDQSGCKNTQALMLMSFGEKVDDVPYEAGVVHNQHFVTADDGRENQPNALPFPQWFQSPQMPQSYFEFLTENPTFLEEASPADMLQSISLPLVETHVLEAVSEIQRELPCKNPETACGSKPAVSSTKMDAWKSKPESYIINSDNFETSADVRNQKPDNEGEPKKKYKSSRPKCHAQQRGKDNGNISQAHPRVTVAETVFLSKPHCNVSRKKVALKDCVSGAAMSYNISRAATSDRQRRVRIAERLDALQGLLPQSVEGSQAAVLAEVIDHIKHLQIQIREVTGSKLGSESTFGPLMFIEGHGHYVVPEQMLHGPLEERVKMLIEEDPSAAIKLLESKGLYIMPMALADNLQQAV